VTAEKKLIKSMVESEGSKSSHSDQFINNLHWPAPGTRKFAAFLGISSRERLFFFG
jgi:hypothetical protein